MIAISLLARIRLLKRILGRIRLERAPAPLPPPIRHRETQGLSEILESARALTW